MFVMNGLQVLECKQTLEDMVSQANLTDENRKNVYNSSIVIVPVEYYGTVLLFPSGTSDFYQYCIEKYGIGIEICSNDEDYKEIEQCSFQLRLGKIHVKEIALGIIGSLIASYTYDALKFNFNLPKPEIKTEYQAEPTVSFSIIVSDSTGTVQKEFKYEGLAKDVKEVTDNIEALWHEEYNKSRD
ncbi:hypothetical protein [Porphyromonas gingivalis]|uniref:hypothetical protein n=1 Tax=Porphyromonas gingivalis TaxID=837 RepID=UPI000BEA0A60|nr:hypothetical protein [Porphyromonas gingivalis]